MLPDATRDTLEALLRWYVDMGVDVAIDAAPHDRFAEAAASPALPQRPRTMRSADSPSDAALAPARRQAANEPLPVPTGGSAAMSADAAVRSARDVAASAPTLDALRAALEGFEGCSLKRTATNLVFADGNPAARVMAVGEAPGAEEDRSGRPFAGRSGQLLDRMLQGIGLDRTTVYIANVVPWRPPGNRTPTPQEVATCLPFIARQIALCDPDILLCLGGASAQSLLGTRDGILRLRGRWFEYDTGTRSVRALLMLHPAYLLRQPAHKKLAWRDLQALRKALDAPPGA